MNIDFFVAPCRSAFSAVGFLPIPALGLSNRPSLFQRLLHNRRNPNARWMFARDLQFNVSDEWFKFTQRLPPNTRIQRDASGQIRGYESKHP